MTKPWIEGRFEENVVTTTVEQAITSVTPMQIDLTRHHGIEPLQNWLERL